MSSLIEIVVKEPLSRLMMTHFCRWFGSSRHRTVIWIKHDPVLCALSLNRFTHYGLVTPSRWHRSGSTLAYVMNCCLMASSHFQCWLIIKGVLRHSPERNFTITAEDINPWIILKNTLLKLHLHLPGANELTKLINSPWKPMLFPESLPGGSEWQICMPDRENIKQLGLLTQWASWHGLASPVTVYYC